MLARATQEAGKKLLKSELNVGKILTKSGSEVDQKSGQMRAEGVQKQDKWGCKADKMRAKTRRKQGENPAKRGRQFRCTQHQKWSVWNPDTRLFLSELFVLLPSPTSKQISHSIKKYRNNVRVSHASVNMCVVQLQAKRDEASRHSS